MKVPSFSGKTLHESLFDPRLFRLQVKQQINATAKKDFSGQTPNIFVGRFGYPDVRIGLLSTETYKNHDNPLAWVQQKTSIQDIVTLRSELVNAGTTAHVKLPSNKHAEKLKQLAQETAMAIKAVDTDISLEKKPQFRLQVNDESMPHGPLVYLEKAELTSNPKIPTIIEKTVGDKDLKAGVGLGRLWKRGYTEHHLLKLLTSGTLGQQLERRLVPTRWGITAVDDIIGKQLHTQVLNNPECDYQVHIGGHLGNYFILLFYPQAWSYELFENAVEKGELSIAYTDYEGARPRTTYAERTAGGYYASRLAVLEHLVKEKRQGGVLALRFITDEYWAPLGVWVVREAVRNALAEKPLHFGSQELAQKYVEAYVKRKFGKDPSILFENSSLLAVRKSQMRLSQYF